MSIVTGEHLAHRFSLVQHGHAARLFHGTAETLDGPIRPGSYDQVFWSAAASTIAQSYIPAAGGKAMLCIDGFKLDEKVRPSRTSASSELVRLMGFEPIDVQWDEMGNAKSWRIPEGYPTYRELSEFVEKTLGYEPASPYSGRYDRTYWLKTGPWDKERQQSPILPANYKMQGSLLVLEGFEGMRFLDISTGEPDLTSLQYHRLRTFEQARAAGLDGIVIDDFCQTDHWNNLGHTSVGFFAHALPRLKVTHVPAVRFDFQPRREDLDIKDTPEYVQLLAHDTPQAQHVEMDAGVAQLLQSVRNAQGLSLLGEPSVSHEFDLPADEAGKYIERQR